MLYVKYVPIENHEIKFFNYVFLLKHIKGAKGYF